MSKAPQNSLTKKHWFGYMFGGWGGCITFALMASTFSIYCTNVLGINATVMGVLTIIWTIWDAINDPMMGALMDKANILARQGAAQTAIDECIFAYEEIWKQWYALYQTEPGCPTLFAKENEIQELIGYNWNRGFDSTMDPLRI